MALIIPVFIPHRGCPHQCLFCNQEKISGTRRTRDFDVKVAEIIDTWLKRSGGHGDVQVAFFGGSFTCLPEEEQFVLLAAVQPYLRTAQVDSIRLSTRPDCISPAICTFLKEHRVSVVELGVQSLTDEVLQKSQRGHDSRQCREAVMCLREAGMRVGLQLMPGLPGETTASLLKSIDQAVAMVPDFIRLYPVVVVQGSPLVELYRKGEYRPLSLNRAVALTARCHEKITAAGIDVIRMGLQPSSELDRSVVAGPYHPAFGELVLSRVWLKKIRRRLASLRQHQSLCITISHRDYSAVVGMKKTNIKRLSQLGYAGRYTIVQDTSMARGSIQYAVC